MEERHSGQNIATEISKITDEFKISDIICGCLHDNASNVDVAMKALDLRRLTDISRILDFQVVIFMGFKNCLNVNPDSIPPSDRCWPNVGTSVSPTLGQRLQLFDRWANVGPTSASHR